MEVTWYLCRRGRWVGGGGGQRSVVWMNLCREAKALAGKNLSPH